MRSIRPFALATGLLLAAAASTSAAEPELRRVLLSTGGVGYFGYEATPDAEGRLWLTVPLAQVDDILKSVCVLGADGGGRSVSLQGPTRLGDLFRGVPFAEVFVATSLQVAEGRDVKGLYAKARAGEITGMTGVDDPYEHPTTAEVTIDTAAVPLEQSVAQAYALLDGLLTPTEGGTTA